jgi:hypothetical protein
MATVCHPDTGKISSSFAGVAKHYGVQVAICPPRSGHRKGVVEKVNHTAAQRWWRTLPDGVTVEQAQADCDRFVRGEALGGFLRGLDTATISKASRGLRAGMWPYFAQPPAPMMPTRILLLLMICLCV